VPQRKKQREAAIPMADNTMPQRKEEKKKGQILVEIALRRKRKIKQYESQ
jgi:hypothetical protein